VFTVILSTKFLEGAWVVVILIPVLALIAWSIGRFYQKLARTLHVAPEAVLDIAPRGDSRRPIVVPVETLNLATVMTLGAACERARDVTAVHVVVDPDEPSTVEAQWHLQFPRIPLVVIDSPYRTVADPIAAYVADRVRKAPYEVTVMVPLLEVRHFYQRPLVNQSLKRLTQLLRKRSHVEVVNYPFTATGAGRKRKVAPEVG
jgi:hypothetical protein